ncbi:conserved protein of unknown function [Thauera humireducens]|uniref:hypothetical protein n=1 Tax=Thauera humireducens TaxID=1134435 RepID=UPI002467A9A1|nr:hypothetical protein [Thauera humireducens]CAH1747856.1 conserved protein of unknown function [Thauera humireducens]
MQPTKGNASITGQGERGANAEQWEISGVSLPHDRPFRYPAPFDPTALALAQMVVEDQDRAQGMTTDDEAVAQLLAAGVPIEVFDMAVIDGEIVTYWAVCWLDDIRSEDAELWLEDFINGLDQVRMHATGVDRLALERIDFYFTDPQYRTAATGRCLPTSAEYSAIVARVLNEQNNGHQH